MTDLQYSDSTWETYDEIKDGAQAAIEEFHLRQRRTTVPARSIPYPIHARPTYQKINEDPAYLASGGALKPFQLTGLNWLAYVWSKGENGILADEVSFVAASSWAQLIPDGSGKDCPISLVPVVPLPHAAAIRPLPRGRPAVDHFRLADAVPRLGARPQRHLLHGLGQVERGHSAVRIRPAQGIEVQRPPHDLRVHIERPTGSGADQVAITCCGRGASAQKQRESAIRGVAEFLDRVEVAHYGNAAAEQRQGVAGFDALLNAGEV